MPRATWEGAILAQSDETVIVEGNHYFPADSLRMEHFKPSEKTTNCFWKGTASYYNIEVNGRVNPDAAWYYPETLEAASEIKGRVAFWRGVTVKA